jgi:hypothetical protein
MFKYNSARLILHYRYRSQNNHTGPISQVIKNQDPTDYRISLIQIGLRIISILNTKSVGYMEIKINN